VDDWNNLFPALNGIVGGFIMALVAWLVGTGKLHLSRETTLYKTLWDTEQEKTRKLDTLNDQLTEDLRRNNETLIATSAGLTKAYDDIVKINNDLMHANKQLNENFTLLKTVLDGKKVEQA
jgi:septal ring factor EnvC (AmiA/AmiB activator)